MSKGIYLFWDNKYEQVIYAGRFGNRQRIKDHFKPSKRYSQKINTYIQEHLDRIESVIFCEFDDIPDDDLNRLEKETIKLFKLNKYRYPNNFVFNFTDGGDGNSGYIASEKTKKKISESLRGHKISPETRKKIGENQPDFSGENNPHWKDYPRIILGGKIMNDKQRYRIKYNGKTFAESVYKKRLYKKWYSKYPDIELIDETI